MAVAKDYSEAEKIHYKLKEV